MKNILVLCLLIPFFFYGCCPGTNKNIQKLPAIDVKTIGRKTFIQLKFK